MPNSDFLVFSILHFSPSKSIVLEVVYGLQIGYSTKCSNQIKTE